MSWLKIAVVGGVNLDVLGRPSEAFRPEDSLIGSIRFSCGGVGHNIAAQAVRTGADVSLYTIFGSDRNAEWLREACQEDGIRTEHSVSLEGKSPVYMAIHGSDGDMLAAINDMCLMERFTPALLEQMLPSIAQADVCVTDTNLSEDTLGCLADSVSVPLVCDPVSVVKAKRLTAILPRIAALKPNLLEARALTGKDSPEECAGALTARGVSMVFISLGKNGLYFSDGWTDGYIKPDHVTVEAQTGAGDALTAGIASGVGQRLDIRECARLGMAAAARYLHL